MKVEEIARSGGGIEVDRSSLLKAIEDFGLHPPADRRVMQEAREFAKIQMNYEVAPVEAFEFVADKTGFSILTCHQDDQITGVGAFILLSRAGRDAILNQQFNSIMPAEEHLATPDDPIWASYAWGGAATTKLAKQLIVGIDALLTLEFFERIPAFAKAVTNDGARALTEYLGYRPLPQSDYYCRPPALVEASL